MALENSYGWVVTLVGLETGFKMVNTSRPNKHMLDKTK
jgi:hypothetical protein